MSGLKFLNEKVFLNVTNKINIKIIRIIQKSWSGFENVKFKTSLVLNLVQH